MSWIINQTKSAYFFEAFTDITVRIAPAQKIISFLLKNPKVLYILLKRAYRENESLLPIREYLVEASAGEKLALTIDTLATRFGIEQDKKIEIPFGLSESDLAAIVGVTRETISREMQKLKNEKIISYDKRHIIVNQPSILKNIQEGIN